MPVVKLETNSGIPEEKHGALMQRLKTAVAAITGHSLAEMRVELAGGRTMRMADSDFSVYATTRYISRSLRPETRCGE